MTDTLNSAYPSDPTEFAKWAIATFGLHYLISADPVSLHTFEDTIRRTKPDLLHVVGVPISPPIVVVARKSMVAKHQIAFEDNKGRIRKAFLAEIERTRNARENRKETK